ncbi:MAG: hypothetical protein JXB62_08210 [Pirellulales bacterium]|nr:hypothetical protein [Pirellulales bacterium]
MRALAMLFSLAVPVGALVAYAQTTQPITPPSKTAYVGGYGGYGPSYHSSTAAEGAMRGLGNVIRSQGQANLDNSAAAVNYSVARSNEIQNYQEYTSAYFDTRAANRRARAAERGPRASMEDLVRYAQAGKPQPLSPSEVDSVNGTITWPAFLASGEYTASRARLEAIFAQRAARGGIGADEYMQAKQVTDRMLAQLQEQVRDIPPAQYSASKRFLQSLAYEAGQPAG